MWGTEVAATLVILGVIALNILLPLALCKALEKWDV